MTHEKVGPGVSRRGEPAEDRGHTNRDLNEGDVLTTCALRFNGYRYAEETGFAYEPAVRRFARTGEWGLTTLEKLTVFFLLQRSLLKWSYEPLDGQHWRAFRSLFLELAREKVPPEYQDRWLEDWKRCFEPRLDEVVSFLRAIHEGTVYRDDFSVSRTERFRGALLGLAAGDAVGTAVEFSPPGSFAPVADLVGGGPFRLAPGQWTDDTSMALCLAESLVERQGFDPVDQLTRYVRWWREGYLSSTGACFDIGTATRAALARFERTGEPYPGDAFPDAAGNGSLMRLAPVPLYFSGDVAEAVEWSGKSSRTTHGSRLAADACRYYGALVWGAVNDVPKEELLREPFEPAPGFWHGAPLAREILEVAMGSYKRREPPAIAGKGFVVKTLEAALWAFHRTDNFRDGCLAVVNLGDDADSTAAVYGQVAGAFYGEYAIPEEWRNRLALVDAIAALAQRLSEPSTRRAARADENRGKHAEPITGGR